MDYRSLTQPKRRSGHILMTKHCFEARSVMAAVGLMLACCSSTVAFEDTVILQIESPAALDQCSRDAPTRGDGVWTPTQTDIVQVEEAVSPAVAARPEASRMTSVPPQGWVRQYVGIVRDGEKFIYGNLLPLHAAAGDRWKEGLVVVCDGGPDFFGIAFDVKRKVVSHLAFNGNL